MDSYSMDEFFESINDDIYDKVYEHMELFIEGKVKNNIPAKEAKKSGNYGKDKLTPEEYDKRAKKRIRSSMQGTTFDIMKNIGNSQYGSIYADPEKEAAYRGKKNKMTTKDILTHPKEVVKGAAHMAKQQGVEQLKRAAITQTSVPGFNPVAAAVPDAIPGAVKAVGGFATDFGINQPFGPGANRNRAKALERITRMQKERQKEIEDTGKVDPLKEQLRQAKGRATVARAMATKPQDKEIEKDHTINTGKTIMGRSFSNKDFSNPEEVKKVFKQGGKTLTTGIKDVAKGNFDTPAAQYAIKHVKRDIINAPKGYKASAEDYGKTVKNLADTAASKIRTAAAAKKKAKTETDK